MNKALIGAIVGGLLLWIWQFLSWTVLGIHSSEMSYTDSNQQIMECLETAGLEEGTYFLPGLPPDASPEAHEAYMEEQTGKPWATISYHKEMSNAGLMNMIRGFVVDVLAVFLLCYILIGRNDLSFQKVLISSVLVGLIGYFTIPYLSSIWFETNSISHLIDAIVSWGLVGSWLGWWLNRGEAA